MPQGRNNTHLQVPGRNQQLQGDKKIQNNLLPPQPRTKLIIGTILQRQRGLAARDQNRAGHL